MTAVMSGTVWGNRAFVLLFSAQVISLLGSGVTTIGLAIFAYQLVGGGSATAIVGNALMLRILAFLIFSQPAGVIADRVSRKQILIGTDVARFALLALFPFVATVWQIYTLIFLINALTACFSPTFEASLPSVVGERHYIQALTWSRIAVDVESVAAPVLAGLLMLWLDVRWVFWADAISYLVSAALIVQVAIPFVPKVLGSWWRGILSDIPYGTLLLLREPSLRQALMLSFAEATAGAAAIVLTVVYVRDWLQRGDTTFAFLMASVGIGSSGMALALGRRTATYESHASDEAALHIRRHRWATNALLLGGLILGLILLPGILMPPLGIFAILWALNGAGQALIAVPSMTLLAEHTEEYERGRAYAAHFALTHAFWLVTYPAVGYAAVWWGAPVVFTAAGVVCLATTVCGLALGSVTIDHQCKDS
jgi:NRE family putative nickel resistance protein-like MFS transporter